MYPVAKSELLLFDELPVQTSIVGAGWSDYHSISDPASTAQLEFYIPGSQDEYIDFNDTKLYLDLHVEGTPNTSVLAPANNMLGTMFSDVSVHLNDVTIQGGEPYYPYKAIIEKLLMFDSGTKETQLRASGFIKDEATRFDAAANTGHAARTAIVTGGNHFELIGPLHIDLATQPRYILPRVDIRLRLVRSTAEFALNSWDTTNALTGAKIVIHKAILYVRKVRVLPSVQHGHELGLATQNAIYPIQHVSMDSHTVPAGQQSFVKENIFQGRMPKFLVVGMVSNAAFVGAYGSNPFNFQSFQVSYVGLFRDGECVPERTPYDMPDDRHYTRAYLGTIHALEQFNRNENNGITLRDFLGGNMLFAFNLTPDMSVGGNSGGCQQPFRNGNLRLEMRFRAALPAAINVIYYGVFDGKVEITKDRAIHLDYL